MYKVLKNYALTKFYDKAYKCNPISIKKSCTKFNILNENIAIIFLGKFSTDARCQNMASSILKSTNYKLSIICLNDENVDNQIFNKINFYYLNISKLNFTNIIIL